MHPDRHFVRPPLVRLAALAASPLVVTLSSCGVEASGVREIRDSVVLEGAATGLEWHAPPEYRFPVRRTAPATRSAGAPSGGGLHWQTPAGWSEEPTSSLRQANFRVPGDDRAECYLTVLKGDGGGLAPNVNRWRRQMSLEPLTEDAIQALPRVPFFGGEGVALDVEGTWDGGDAPGEDFRLVAIAQLAQGEARFLKLVGPSAVVAAERERFLALAASFHANHDGHSHGDGHDHASPSPAAAATPSSRFTWEAPEGWREGEPRRMREVTYFVGEGDAAECYVSLLGGDGGGLEANIQRWCDQMGAAQLSEVDFAALERLPVLGGEGVLLEVDGHYAGMGEADLADARLLGLVCLLGDTAVFVKMIGPVAVVDAERESFVRFCKSLSLGSRSR